MKSTTPWQNIDLPRFHKLTGTFHCDVLVIGGGVTGLTAAYLLKRAGKRVAVLERNQIAGGDTGCTTAHLTCVSDLPLTDLASTFGRDAAKLVWDGGNAAVNTIEQIGRTADSECDFHRVPGFRHNPVGADDDALESLQEECELANDLGYAATFLDEVPHVGQPGVRYPNQAKFHPLRYLAALARAIDGAGSEVFEESEAREFSENPRSVKTSDGEVRCEYVVIATHVPLVGMAGLVGAAFLQTKLAPYTSYAIGARIPRNVLGEASYWDTADPYNYLRVDRGHRHDYAIFGGEDHKTGQADDAEQRHARLEERLRLLVPSAEINHHWSGQVIETNDGLPYIGETADGQFAATGFSGNGMTFGTLAGMMACDAVFDRPNPWKEIFAIDRTTVRSAWDYVKENADYPYFLVRDRLAPAEATSVDEIKPGEGKIVRSGGRRLACARDEHGDLTTLSAVCTHMGCIVRWNGVEKTWDCPCHGSRFLATGEVLAGPAEAPLESAQIASDHATV